MVRKFLVFGISIVIICLSLVGCKVYELSGLGSFEGLDSEIELQIIKTYFGEDYKGQESIDKEIIADYLGTYGDCVVIRFYGGWSFGMGPMWEIIDEVLFVLPPGKLMAVWKEDKTYSLDEAYVQGLLTKKNLDEINVQDKVLYPELYDPNNKGLKKWLEWYYERNK